MGRLDGSTVVISGGARGQGASHVRGLVGEGARVVFGDVLESEGRALAAEIGEAGLFTRLDVTQPDSWAAAVQLAEERFGSVDVLINNAGVMSQRSLEDTSLQEFRRVIDINLIGCFNGMHAVIPAMRRAGGGVIVNVSSAVAILAFPQVGAYVASKWGIRGLTKTAALELGQHGIRVVSILPGPVRTAMTEGMGEGQYSGQALARIAEPEEITRLVTYIIAEGTYSTGCEFIIDGGFSLGLAEGPVTRAAAEQL